MLYIRSQPAAGGVTLGKDSSLHPSKDCRSIDADDPENIRRAHSLIQAREPLNCCVGRRLFGARWSRRRFLRQLECQSELFRMVSGTGLTVIGWAAAPGLAHDAVRHQRVRRRSRTAGQSLPRIRSGLGSGWVRRGTHKIPGVAGREKPTATDTRCNADRALPSGESIEFHSTHLLQVPGRRVAVATPGGLGRTVAPSHAWPS